MTDPTAIATTAPSTGEREKPANPLPQIIGWILDGNSEAKIIEAIEATWPKRKARPLIIEAMEHISAAGNADGESVRGFAIEGTRVIYQRCMQTGDYATALRALKQIVELSK